MAKKQEVEGAVRNCREDTSVCCHESLHVCAALSRGVPIKSVTVDSFITPDGDVYEGEVVYLTNFEGEQSEVGGFCSLAAVVGSQIFSLSVHSVAVDLVDVRKYITDDAAEERVRQDVRQFIEKDRLRILKMGHALQILRTIDGSTAQSIYDGEDVSPEKFPAFLEIIERVLPVTWFAPPTTCRKVR